MVGAGVDRLHVTICAHIALRHGLRIRIAGFTDVAPFLCDSANQYTVPNRSSTLRDRLGGHAIVEGGSVLERMTTCFRQADWRWVKRWRSSGAGKSDTTVESPSPSYLSGIAGATSV